MDKEPTSDQCSKLDKVFEDENNVGYACWYPQMGGYVGKAIAVFDKKWTEYDSGAKSGGCLELYVWHDGEFPFNGEDDGRKPCHLHHCDPEQFIRFGQELKKINDGFRNTAERP